MEDHPDSFDRALNIYCLYIEYIRHENELIHQRAARFIGIQAALIGTSGLIFQKYLEITASSTPPKPSSVASTYLFLMFIAIAGVMSSFSALTSLRAARAAQFATYKAYHDLPPYNTAPRGYGKSASLLGLPALMGGGAELIGIDINKSDRKGGAFLVYLPITMAVLWALTIVIILLFMFHLNVSVNFRGS